ncbi:hypothetical protein BU25DRAFT_410471 [Macroventuria anomochaeta]|uniref:Uncharacterized protein n=1 Tax=Macroventuria anomochaeta TaxID=301207 RepID=A0ACB6S0J5_9PLEO|nr:uncharacterized protein BU25DRAFT_410471 [Macroventuria anomochaeta]KAF2627815.1 hypothetical protein BU25DRAFT_410471 [Macroventuria anomochaeta]
MFGMPSPNVQSFGVENEKDRARFQFCHNSYTENVFDLRPDLTSVSDSIKGIERVNSYCAPADSSDPTLARLAQSWIQGCVNSHTDCRSGQEAQHRPHDC